MAATTIEKLDRRGSQNSYGQAYAANVHATEALLTHADMTIVPTRAISVGAGGAIACRFAGRSADVTITLPAGIHQLALTHIRATGTTATGIFCLL